MLASKDRLPGDDPHIQRAMLTRAFRQWLLGLRTDEHGHLPVGTVLLVGLLVAGASFVAGATIGHSDGEATAQRVGQADGQLTTAASETDVERVQPPNVAQEEVPEDLLEQLQPDDPDDEPDEDSPGDERDADRVPAESAGCGVHGPTVEPSPVVAGGTRFAYAVQCGVSHFNSMTVQLRGADGQVLAAIAEQTPLLADALHARQYDIPTSLGALGVPDGLCVSIRVDDRPVENDPGDSCISVRSADGQL